MPRGRCPVAEPPGRLDDDLRSRGGPRDRGRIVGGEERHLDAVDDERDAVRLDGAREGAVGRVVAQKLRRHLDPHQVVDAGPFDRLSTGVRGAEGRAARAAEAVDPNTYGHVFSNQSPAAAAVGVRTGWSGRPPGYTATFTTPSRWLPNRS